jgi:RNA polymerase sigma-70 factor (ECF subfamily)
MQAVEPKLARSGAPEMSLVHAAKDGDLAAFDELVRRYDRKVFRIARNITQNREDAKDVAQDAFLKAFRGLARFEEKSRFSTWLFRITVNESLMKLRQRRGFREVSIDEDDGHESGVIPLQIADWTPNPEQLYSRSELRKILAKALQKLSPSHRTIFLLRDVEGFSTEETAEALNLSASAVKTRLLRARLNLRERLHVYFSRSAKPKATGTPERSARVRGAYATRHTTFEIAVWPAHQQSF